MIDVLLMYDSYEPKSGYLSRQMSQVIRILGSSKKRWLIPILRPYTKVRSKIMREAAMEAIAGLH